LLIRKFLNEYQSDIRKKTIDSEDSMAVDASLRSAYNSLYNAWAKKLVVDEDIYEYWNFLLDRIFDWFEKNNIDDLN